MRSCSQLVLCTIITATNVLVTLSVVVISVAWFVLSCCLALSWRNVGEWVIEWMSRAQQWLSIMDCLLITCQVLAIAHIPVVTLETAYTLQFNCAHAFSTKTQCRSDVVSFSYKWDNPSKVNILFAAYCHENLTIRDSAVCRVQMPYSKGIAMAEFRVYQQDDTCPQESLFWFITYSEQGSHACAPGAPRWQSLQATV